MPYLGPGVGQNVNPAVYPTWVFTPTPNVSATVRITNNSGNTVWIGGPNVSQFNGIPLAPGNRPIELQNCPYTIYTASGCAPNGALATTITGSQVQGASALTVASATTGFGVGNVVQVGNGTNLEYMVIATAFTAGTGGTLTTTNAFLYDHVASSTVSTVTARPASVLVTAGVV